MWRIFSYTNSTFLWKLSIVLSLRLISLTSSLQEWYLTNQIKNHEIAENLTESVNQFHFEGHLLAKYFFSVRVD